MVPERLTSSSPYPEIPDVVPWGDFGGIIGRYDEALTNCNTDKAGIRTIIDDYLMKLNQLMSKE